MAVKCGTTCYPWMRKWLVCLLVKGGEDTALWCWCTGSPLTWFQSYITHHCISIGQKPYILHPSLAIFYWFGRVHPAPTRRCSGGGVPTRRLPFIPFFSKTKTPKNQKRYYQNEILDHFQPDCDGADADRQCGPGSKSYVKAQQLPIDIQLSCVQFPYRSLFVLCSANERRCQEAEYHGQSEECRPATAPRGAEICADAHAAHTNVQTPETVASESGGRADQAASVARHAGRRDRWCPGGNLRLQPAGAPALA